MPKENLTSTARDDYSDLEIMAMRDMKTSGFDWRKVEDTKEFWAQKLSEWKSPEPFIPGAVGQSIGDYVKEMKIEY